MISLYADEIKRVKDLLTLMDRGAKRSLGQNFLINSKKIDLIVKQLQRLPHESVVEVGPGLGALTLRLKDAEKNLVLIEMDRQFADYWLQQNFNVVVADALNYDWAELKLNNAVLISNLPYQIAGRMVVERSVEPSGVTSMVLMFQKEVAKRLTAKPKTEDFSLLSVMAQTFWKLEMLTELGPNDYFPAPKIASRVVIFTQKNDHNILDKKAYLSFVKASFSQKRKFLKKSLISLTSEERVEAAFAQLEISLKARPEELDVLTFIKLYQTLMVV